MNASEWNDRALSLIRKAVLAPSSHNTQPWLLRITAATINSKPIFSIFSSCKFSSDLLVR